MADQAAEHKFSFGISLDSLPPTGSVYQIFDTETETDGALDVYVNDSGNLVFEIDGFISDTYWDGSSTPSRK